MKCWFCEGEVVCQPNSDSQNKSGEDVQHFLCNDCGAEFQTAYLDKYDKRRLAVFGVEKIPSKEE